MMMIQLKITIILYKNCLTMDNGNTPDWELSFNVRIATQTILSEVVKVVQVNNATDVRVAGNVLLPSTTYKAYLPN